MSIYTEINKAWATLFGFKVENDEATFNDKPLYWNNNAVETWDDLLSAKPSDLKQSAGFAEVPNTKTYDELMTAENFSYGAFDWTNEHGERLGFALGNIQALNMYNSTLSLSASPFGVSYFSDDHEVHGLGLEGANNTQKYADFSFDGVDFEQEGIDVGGGAGYCALYALDIENQIVTALIYLTDGEVQDLYIYGATSNNATWEIKNTWDWYGSANMSFYFDDGAHLPAGLEWDTNLASYFVPKMKETETTTILTQTTATQAMLGAQIMTHVSLWGMGIGCACFIVALVKFMGRCFSRR